MGFSLTEWEAPVPTLWSEHLHQVNLAARHRFSLIVDTIKAAPKMQTGAGLVHDIVWHARCCEV